MTYDVIYLMQSSLVKYLFASIIDAFKASNKIELDSASIFNKIFSQISLSEIIPKARNNTNNGTGCFTRDICTCIGFPNPLFFEHNIIFNCLGEIHLKSGTDFISAIHEYFVLFFETLKQYTLFSAALSCPKTVFSDPFIIK